MYKEAINLIVAVAVGAAVTSCGSKTADAAQELVAEVRQAIDAEQYDQANDLLDTLKVRYPKAIKAQREGMHLQALVNEGLIKRQIVSTDSIIAYDDMMIDSLKRLFAYVDNPQLVEGYYVVKELEKNTLFERNGVEGRVTPDGQFYMMSSLVGNPVKHTSVSVSVGGSIAQSSTVSYDGERNYRSGSTEMITFVGSECDSIGRLLAENPDAKAQLTFHGSRNYSVALSRNDARSIGLSWRLSKSMKSHRTETSRRELLDKQLILARDQAARTLTTDQQ